MPQDMQKDMQQDTQPIARAMPVAAAPPDRALAEPQAVSAGALDWHVQWWRRALPAAAAPRPLALLLHGTGASADSFGRRAPWLLPHFDLLAPDLPGHGRTRLPSGAKPSLPWMAAQVHALLRTFVAEPMLVIGHSAGAAIAIEMCLAGHLRARAVVSLNGALLPMSGPVGRFFSPLARLLVLNPLVPRFFAWQASGKGVVERLLEGTGSRLDAEGVAMYRALVRDPDHAAGALRMMAAWDLAPLAEALPRLTRPPGPVPLHLVVGLGDRTVPPAQAQQVAARVPGAVVHQLPGLGHLAHEEDPAAVFEVLQRAGLLAPSPAPVPTPRHKPGAAMR